MSEQRFLPDYAFDVKKRLKKNAFDSPIKLDGTIKCICCGIELKPERDDEAYKHNCSECGNEKEVGADSVMVNNGAVKKIYMGYGSQYDACIFMLGVCDNCIENALKGGKLIYYGRYM